MLDLLPVINLTPYTVIVYSGFSHWSKPIDELEESFSTKDEAEDYVRTIAKYNPKYWCKIVED